MRNSFPILPALVISALIFLVSFFAFDAGLGKADGTTASVTGKNYVAEWTQFIWHSDANGGGWMQTIYHPAQHILIFDNGMEVDVKRSLYHNVNRGQACVLTYRVGKWTGIKYGADVHKSGPVEK